MPVSQTNFDLAQYVLRALERHREYSASFGEAASKVYPRSSKDTHVDVDFLGGQYRIEIHGPFGEAKPEEEED